MSLILQPRLGPQGADTPISKAHQVCLACRKQKRRCDKSLPACSLCKRMDRPCYYSYSLGGGNGKSTLDSRHQPVIAEDLQALKARLAELESRLLLNGGSGSRGTSSSPGAMMAGREEVGLLGGAGPMDEDILDGMSVATAATAVIGGGSSTTGSLFSTAALHDLRWLDRPAANKFPSVYFLDRDAFKWMAKTIPRPRNVEIPGVSSRLRHLANGELASDTILCRTYSSTLEIVSPSSGPLQNTLPRFTSGCPLYPRSG